MTSPEEIQQRIAASHEKHLQRKENEQRFRNGRRYLYLRGSLQGVVLWFLKLANDGKLVFPKWFKEVLSADHSW